MRNNKKALLIILLFALIFIPACGGGGGGGTSDVNTSPITFNSFVDGDLLTYRTENWTVTIPNNTFISVELYGIRLNQTAWTDSTFNAPVIKLLDSSGSPILQHDIDANAWIYGHRDTEIPLHYVETGGSYTIQVSRKSAAADGGPYKLRLNDMNPTIISDYGFNPSTTPGDINGETDTALDENDTLADADLITRAGTSDNAIVFGRYENGDPDFYSITITPAASEAYVSCFEIIAYRNGIALGESDYYDPELTFYAPTDSEENIVDDSFFSDAQVCQKVSNPGGTYKVRIDESFFDVSDAAANYLLTYNEQHYTVVDEGELSDNDNHTDANVIGYGDLVEGILDTSDEDWFRFSADQGDKISIQQFDHDNAADSDGTISIELYDSLNNIIPFNGPAAVADGRNAATLADLTTTSILVQETGDYRIRVLDDADTGTTPKNYAFLLKREKTSVIEVEPNNLDTEADILSSTTGTGSGIISTISDDDWFELDTPTMNNLSITSGDLIAVHIYATRDIDQKAFASTGYGSNLEPKITVYDNALSIIKEATYTDDTINNASSEGIIGPFPSLTTVFVDTGAPAYLFKVENGGTYDNTALDAVPSYLIEVVNLGQ